jgi:hypothetical protein
LSNFGLSPIFGLLDTESELRNLGMYAKLAASANCILALHMVRVLKGQVKTSVTLAVKDLKSGHCRHSR